MSATRDIVRDAPRLRRREVGQDPPRADDEWPTTQRFSRRAGEAFRGAEYAAAVELPAGSPARDVAIAVLMVIGALLGAAVTVLWRV